MNILVVGKPSLKERGREVFSPSLALGPTLD